MHAKRSSFSAQPHVGETARWPAACWIAVACLAAFALTAATAASRLSATFDEVPHLSAGYSYLKWNDYRINPEHPPLVKKLAAAPLLLLGVEPAEIDATDADFRAAGTPSARLALKQTWAHALYDTTVEWTFGHFLLFGLRDETLARFGAADANGAPTTARLAEDDYLNPAGSMLFWGRMPIVALGVGAGALVFLWSWRLFGAAGAVVSVALFAFDPNFLAHSSLVTTDVGMSLFMLGTMYCTWRACERLSWGAALGAMAFFSLAVTTKFSAVLLVPIVALSLVERLVRSDPWPIALARPREVRTVADRAITLLLLTLAAAMAAYVSIWAVYGFRFSAVADPQRAALRERQLGVPARNVAGRFDIVRVVEHSAQTRAAIDRWMAVPGDKDASDIDLTLEEGAPLGLMGEAILWAYDLKLLPESFLYGFAFVEMRSHVRGSFLLGRRSLIGFRDYFLWSYLLKTPLSALAATAVSLIVALVWPATRRGNLCYLLVPVGVYLAVSVVSNLNIGHRHILPIYPFLYVLCGTLGAKWSAWRPAVRWPVAVLSLAIVATSAHVVLATPWRPAIVFPNFLAYFNELAGGPREGYKSLVDSNLDWGKDLVQLEHWLADHNVSEPIKLCYFGTADPQYYGIEYELVVGEYPFRAPKPLAEVERTGLLAVSATSLAGAYLDQAQRDELAELLRGAELVDVVGFSTFIYRLDAPASESHGKSQNSGKAS